MNYARGLLTPVLVTIVGVGTGRLIMSSRLSQNCLLTFVQESRYSTQHSSKIKSRRNRRSRFGPVSKRSLPATNQHVPSIDEFNDQQAPSPAEQVRKTEETVANAGGATTIPKDTERWSEAQIGQFSKPVDTFKWSEVPLDQYSTSEKSS